MAETTVNLPTIDTEAHFTFKEPFNYSIKNRFNINESSVKLKIVSIINMKDMIKNDLRDPFTEIYVPAGINEVEYKKDLIDNIVIVSLCYIDRLGVERFFRVPVNYIATISTISNVEYINKLILIDLNRLPKTVDTSLFFTDLKDFIESRIGINPEIKEVNVGSTELVNSDEHSLRETIRNNSITVYKTLSVQLLEVSTLHNQMLDRLDSLNISLG